MENGSTVTLNSSTKNLYASLRSSTLPRNLSIKSGTLKSGASTPGVPKRRSFIVRIRTINVVFIDGTTKLYEIDANQDTQLLFDYICQDLLIDEVEYFGLKITETNDKWLDLNKKISDQIKKNNQEVEFQFRYYPPSVDWLEKESTRYLLVQQIRQDILSKKLPASQFMLAMLSAYIIQSEVGDYDSAIHSNIEYLKKIKLVPREHETNAFYTILHKLHQQHKGTTSEMADKKFIENARRIALYGNEFHEAQNDAGESVKLGVGSTGLILLKNDLRVNRFSWPMIVKFSLENKQVSIHHYDPDPVDYTKTEVKKDDLNFELRKLFFNFSSREKAEAMYNSFIDHHSFFRIRTVNSIRKKPKKPILISKFSQLSRTSSAIDQNQYWTLEQGTSKNDISKLHLSRNNVYPFYSHSFSRQSLSNKQGSTVSLNNEVIRANSTSTTKLHVDPGIFFRNSIKLIEDKIKNKADFPIENFHWNSSDCTPQVGFSKNELDIKALADNGGQGVRATCGVRGPGAYYYETRVMHGNIIRIGWSTAEGSLNLGSDPFGFGYGSNVTHLNSVEHGRALETGDLIGCYLLLEADERDKNVVKEGKCFWTLNGSVPNKSDPEAHVKIPGELLDQPFYPTCSLLDARILSLFSQKPTFDPLNRKIEWIPVQLADQTKIQREVLRGWRMNPRDTMDEKSISISPDGRIVKSIKNTGWQGIRSNKGVRESGKYHYEAKVTEKTNHIKIGWATEDASLILGSDSLGYAFGNDRDSLIKQSSRIFHTDMSESYGESINKDDVIGCFLNLDQGIIHWTVNGKKFGDAYKLERSAIINKAFYPTVTLKNTTVEFNFGEKSFSYPTEAGWLSLLWAKETFVTETTKWKDMVKEKNLRDSRKTMRADLLTRIRGQKPQAAETSKCKAEQENEIIQDFVLEEKDGSNTKKESSASSSPYERINDEPVYAKVNKIFNDDQTPIVKITDTSENKKEDTTGEVKGKNPFDEVEGEGEIKPGVISKQASTNPFDEDYDSDVAFSIKSLKLLEKAFESRNNSGDESVHLDSTPTKQ